MDALYGDEPPAGAANALQSQVSRLRRTLAIEHGPAGYRLAADPDDVDVLRFERLARDGARAREAGDAGRAAVLLREALGLWRGPALVDVADAPFAAAQSARLEELRAAAVKERAEAELALDTDPAELLGWLREAVAAHPLRERLRGQLMRALRRAGQWPRRLPSTSGPASCWPGNSAPTRPRALGRAPVHPARRAVSPAALVPAPRPADVVRRPRRRTDRPDRPVGGRRASSR